MPLSTTFEWRIHPPLTNPRLLIRNDALFPINVQSRYLLVPFSISGQPAGGDSNDATAVGASLFPASNLGRLPQHSDSQLPATCIVRSSTPS